MTAIDPNLPTLSLSLPGWTVVDVRVGAPFWGKMAAFAIVGALSIVPTLTILRCSRRREQEPPAAEVALVRRFVQFQLVLFPSIPLMAALVATGGL